MSEIEVTLDDNWYAVLGLPLGAPMDQARSAFDRLAPAAREAADAALLSRLEEAHTGLTHQGMRDFHNQQLKWAAARDWYRQKYPAGRSVEEHRLWANYRRGVLTDEEPSWWQRFRGVAAS